MGHDIHIDSAGQAVRALRMDAELSLQELADRLGWDKGRLSKYETNRLGMSVGVIEEIARALRKPPLVVILHCLRHRYPDLQRKGSRTAQLLEALVQDWGKNR